MKFYNSFKSKVLGTISVPEDLSPLITYDPADEADPADAAMTCEDIDAIWTSVEDLYRSGVYPGITFCMRRKGVRVLNRAIGHSHGNGPDDSESAKKVLMTPDTPLCQYSASKAVTALLIHLLVERGAISLSDPVMKYIPEFAVHGKHRITILNVISHHGGIPRPPRNVDPDILYDNENLVQMICDLKPTSKDGGNMAYHAVTGGTILGEIIRRVTGKNIRELLTESIREPLGFQYFNYGVPKEDFYKIATDYSTGLPNVFPVSAIVKRALSVSWNDVVRIANQPRFYEVIVPAANLVATADEMSQFYQLLLNGGTLNGKRIFEPSAIQQAVAPAAKMWFDGSIVIPMRYSAGLMLGALPVGIWGPYSESAYGHIGFINIFCWADPARDISVSLQTTGKSLAGPHIGPLVKFLFTVGRHCRMNEEVGGDPGSFASFKAPFQKMLRKLILGI
jgi:CubicO group peptidase (beta-lactamase class C family)